MFAGRPELGGGPPKVAPYEETMPGIVRPRLAALLSEVRAAQTNPWTRQVAGVNAILFHQMANWLPPAERDQLRAEFVEELRRIGVAPFIP